MKVLIAYDGSNCSEAALDDLRRAGLPDQTEALIISVAEVWLPPPPENETLSEYAKELQTNPQPFKAWQNGAKAVSAAEDSAAQARERLQRNFPQWKIETEATFGSPAWEILNRAAVYKPDLIVVGSHGRSAISRLLLGSISQKILTEAACSVRVARGKVEVDPVPSRIIIGFDGSKGSIAAVETVASRHWRAESEFKLVAAIDLITPSAFGQFIPPVAAAVDDVNIYEQEWIEKLAAPYLELLKNAGLKAELQAKAGNPKQVVVDEAEIWHADAIFVGANAFGSRLERFLLGSVSAAVAARAHCSVEVVRKQIGNQDQE